jgi:glycerol-1-phosphate dehydrogenase [NAD(P)+]
MTQTTNTSSLAEALHAARETRCLEIGTGVINDTPRVFRKQFGDRPAVIVSDANAFAVAGQTVQEAFRAAGQPVVEPFIFRAPDLHAEHHLVVELETALRQHESVPVAVGAGTINDLTKLAAHRAGRPYLCVATAASMDGYTAFGASITFQGSKQTFSCPAPVAVVADLNIISAAPPEMNASGYADLLAKVTAGADWIVADALGAEAIDPKAWDIVQGALRNALANPSGVRSGDLRAIGQLTEGLMLGGLAMQWARSSRPASGAEHQFSHLWDMQHHTHNGSPPSHGFKVGIGTLAVSALYERLLELPLDQLDVAGCCAAWPDEAGWETKVRRLFNGDELLKVALPETRAKACPREVLCGQLERLRSTWPQLRQRLRAQLIPFVALKEMLQAAGAPVEPEQIGISRTRLRDSFWQAYCIRRRFTMLDLAARAGLLDRCLEQIFGASGVWPARSENTRRLVERS